MKKALAFFLLIGIVISTAACSGNTRVDNDKAEGDRWGRYLTIINETDQIINEVHVTVGDGSEIEHAYQENPDEESFSIKIPREYKKETTFTVTLIDRYGLQYQKVVENVEKRGRTEVKFTEDDYVEQDGDFAKKITQRMNGD